MQSEKVINPPLTRADSVGVNSRAPRRISTLFWSFMLFSFRHFESVERAQSFQQKNSRLSERDKRNVAPQDATLFH